jgi:alpha-tubulin suppressor-like RCC1 family protein
MAAAAVAFVAASLVWVGLAVSAPAERGRPESSARVSRFGLGIHHSCALTGATAACWGMNSVGELGDGTTTDRNVPTAVDASGVLDGVTLTQVGGGLAHSCALSSAGVVYCWGWNGAGQLGDGTHTNRWSPVAVDTSGVLHAVTVTQIAVGPVSVCALSSAGAVYCWGRNDHGQLGDGTNTDRWSPVAVDTGGALHGVTVTQISGQARRFCALSSAGAVYCWGGNDRGELGDGSTTDRWSPVAVDTGGALHGVTVTRIAAGGVHGCALSSVGVAYCWGWGMFGSVGDGTNTNRWSPVAVDTSGALNGVTLTDITAGDGHTCALSSAGVAYCWGWNFVGQVGDGTTTDHNSPVAVDMAVLAGGTFAQIGSGGYHNCAVSSEGATYCWGTGTNGRLGDGDTEERDTPVLVSAFPDTPPGAPTGVAAVAGVESASVSWTRPSFVGSGPLTGYTVTASPGGATCTTSGATSCTVHGLAGGQRYTFTVVAHADGDSAASAASAAVRPSTGLADTGPAVAEMALSGLWLVVVGAGALTAVRRYGPPRM